MNKQQRAALQAADQALTDWVRSYASDQCSVKSVQESGLRIFAAGGTLAYIANIRKQIKEALRK